MNQLIKGALITVAGYAVVKGTIWFEDNYGKIRIVPLSDNPYGTGLKFEYFPNEKNK